MHINLYIDILIYQSPQRRIISPNDDEVKEGGNKQTEKQKNKHKYKQKTFEKRKKVNKQTPDR